MATKEVKSRYRSKAIDSFNTKLNLFLFQNAMNENLKHKSLEEFRSFQLPKDSELVRVYTTQYWQLPEENKFGNVTIRQIYNRIKTWKEENKEVLPSWKNDYLTHQFPKIHSIEDFEQLLNRKNCCYCGISIVEIEELADKEQLYKKSLRGWNLEVERLDSNLEYSKENCEMACYWCNNAKTDEFTYEEFKKIGKSIKKTWELRLGRKFSEK